MPSTLPSPHTVPTPQVGTVSVLVVSQNVTRAALAVFNPNTSATIAICPSDNVPVINGLGTITLPPGQGVQLDGWTNGLNAIASAPSQQITVYEFYQ